MKWSSSLLQPEVYQFSRRIRADSGYPGPRNGAGGLLSVPGGTSRKCNTGPGVPDHDVLHMDEKQTCVSVVSFC